MVVDTFAWLRSIALKDQGTLVPEHLILTHQLESDFTLEPARPMKLAGMTATQIASMLGVLIYARF